MAEPTVGASRMGSPIFDGARTWISMRSSRRKNSSASGDGGSAAGCARAAVAAHAVAATAQSSNGARRRRRCQRVSATLAIGRTESLDHLHQVRQLDGLGQHLDAEALRELV